MDNIKRRAGYDWMQRTNNMDDGWMDKNTKKRLYCSDEMLTVRIEICILFMQKVFNISI